MKQDCHIPATILMIGLVIIMAPSGAIALKCPPNSYEISHVETTTKERLDCSCNVGFTYQNDKCQRVIPDASLRQGTPFLSAKLEGEVYAYLVVGGQRWKVDPGDHAMVANVFVTQKTGKLIIYLPSGKRIFMAPNSDVILGPPLSEFDLNILSASGWFRFDRSKKEIIQERLKKAMFSAYKFGRKWLTGVKSRRFKIRTPNASIGVRGTDYLIKADGQGNFEISVIEGIIDLVPDKTSETVTLKAGERALLTVSGGVDRLAHLTAEAIEEEWRKRNGVEPIQVSQSRK